MHENVRQPNVFVHRRELSALRPDEFVAARAALVKRLKADGHKDDAALVAKLRRPSVVAWALNQVARTAPDLVEAAIDAGQRLRAASEQAVAGDPGDLRAATAAERQAANAVVKEAAKHLDPRADALAPALLSTIRVAALDEEVADELRDGVLVTEHEQPGFGFGLEGEVALAQAPRASKASKARAAGSGSVGAGAAGSGSVGPTRSGSVGASAAKAGAAKAGAAKAGAAKAGAASAGATSAGATKAGAARSRSAGVGGGKAVTAKAGPARSRSAGAAKGAARTGSARSRAATGGSGGVDASTDHAADAEATLRARDLENAEREAAQRAARRAAEKERKRELAVRQRTADRRTREAARLAKEADVAEADAREARTAADRAAREADAARQAVEEIDAPG